MKQIKIILVLSFTFSLTAWGFINLKNGISSTPNIPCSPAVSIGYIIPNGGIDFIFDYNIDSRFNTTITKEALDKAQTIADIMPIEDQNNIESYFNIELSTFNENRNQEVKAKAPNEVLNDDQRKIIYSMGYASSFYITGNLKRNVAHSNALTVDTIVRYITVVPSKEASYINGKDALLSYLRQNSEEAISIARRNNTHPGKISFLVTKEGGIEDVELTFSCGHHSIDEKMVQLIRELPGSWNAATNANGDKVDQELTYFFGLIGC